MADDSLFDTPKERLAWGIEAVADFEREVAKCFEGWIAKTSVEVDPKTGEEVVYYRLKADLSSATNRRANEAIEAFKHSFDQAMFAACKALVPTIRPNDKIGFPWAETENGLRAILASKNSRIPAELHPVLFRLKPYGTGDGCAINEEVPRKLAQIANRKHSIGLKIVPQPRFFRTPPIRYPLGGYPNGAPRFTFIPQWDPVEQKVEFMRGPPGYGAYIQENAEVGFQIALDEPAPLGDIPFTKAMDSFAYKADAVIKALELEVASLVR